MRDQWNVFLATHTHWVNLRGVWSSKIDLSHERELTKALAQLRPNLVVHTAGIASVDQCELDPALAQQVNADVAGIVARVTARIGAKLVHVSTDHLFSGSDKFYPESAKTEPMNTYARTKLMAEKYVLQAHPDALVLRTNFFGWGHALRQSLSDWTLAHLRSANSMVMFDDVFFTPILIDDLVKAVHELVDQGLGGVVNIVGDERVSKYDFALSVASAFSLPSQHISRGSIGDAKLPAPRPRDMSLDNSKAKALLGRPLGKLDYFLAALREQERQGRSEELQHAVIKSVHHKELCQI